MVGCWSNPACLGRGTLVCVCDPPGPWYVCCTVLNKTYSSIKMVEGILAKWKVNKKLNRANPPASNPGYAEFLVLGCI